MDIIFIRQLSLQAVIGVYEWERQHPQPLYMDLDMAVDTRPAARSDAIDDALDYHQVSRRIEDYVNNSRFQLVETLAEQCARLIMEEFSVAGVKLTLHKPQALMNADSVGVCIQRGVIC